MTSPAQASSEHQEPETSLSPAFVANVPQYRVFARDLGKFKYPFRTELYVDNTRGTGIVKLIIHCGTSVFTRRVGISGTLDFGNQGPIYGYSLESTSGDAADIVTVYENGGLSAST